MAPIQKGRGLSSAVQWNHGIASAGSERRLGRLQGGEVCLYTQPLLSPAVDCFYFMLACFPSPFFFSFTYYSYIQADEGHQFNYSVADTSDCIV